MNKEAAITQANLNRIDQVTPEGTLKYSQQTNADGTPSVNEDGTPRYTQTMSLSADEQAKYDQSNKVALALGGLANDNIGRVTDAQSKPFTYDGMTPVTTSVQAGGLSNGPAAGALKSIGDVGGTRSIGDVGTTRSIGAVGTTRGIGDVGRTQDTLDYSGLTKLPGTDDFSADAKRVSDSVYSQAASRLNPQWAQNDNDVKAQLAAQGISENSDAYRRAYDNLSRAKNDAYTSAQNSAQQAGAAEQSRIFGLAMSARQQGQNEVNTQGNFVNSAEAQRFQQEAARTDVDNANQRTAFDQEAARTSVDNQNQKQRFDQEQTRVGVDNQTQAQRFDQEQARVGMDNTNQGVMYDQARQAADIFNQNQTTRFNQDAANAALNNSGRQQQIQEATYLRNLPLNDIAALLGTGPGVAQPDFNPVSQVGVAAPDQMGMVQSNYQSQVQQAQAKAAAKSQMLGSIFGAVGTGASMFAGSDVRFKENIKRIGTLANGIATYAFRYLGDTAQRFGVMAQDVIGVMPEAVAHDADGYMYVDYGKVYA